MSIRMKLAALCSLLLSCAVMAQTDNAITSTEVVPGMYSLDGAIGNITLLVGEDAVVLIDDGIEPMAPQLLDAVAQHTDRPVDFVINTHVHGDHIGASRALHMSGATIVAHDNIRKRLIEVGWQTREGFRPAEKIELPEITFSDAVTFHLNDHEAYVFHLATAHTDGDAAIHFRDVDVIHAGDLFFNGMYPFIDLDSGGTVAGYLAAQQRIINMAGPDTIIIAGHGPVGSRAELQAASDMLTDAEARVKALVDAGQTEDQIVSTNPLAIYDEDWTWGFINTERMTRALYRSLTSH